MSYTQREKKIRESIEVRKPRCWEKIQNINEQVKAGRSIALMQVQFSYDCVLRCAHCAISKFRENIPEPMSIPNLKILADEADSYGLSSICVSGGEPLSFLNLEEIIDTIDSSRFVLSLDTNGMYLDENKIIWLVDKGVDRIHLSIDGLESNHAGFRGKKGLWQHNVDMLKVCKQYGLGVVVNVVATKDLVHGGELEKQLELLQSYDHHVSMIFPKPVGTFEDAKDQILNTKDMEYLETLTKKYNCSTHLTPAYGRDMGCIAAKRHFSCLPNGFILVCPWIPIHFGNVFEEGLETILDRMLKIPYFSWDNKMPCASGNSDSFFYQNIIPQIEEHDEYPVDWRKIDFKLEYFDGE